MDRLDLRNTAPVLDPTARDKCGGLRKGDIAGQVRFVNRTFGLAAWQFTASRPYSRITVCDNANTLIAFISPLRFYWFCLNQYADAAPAYEACSAFFSRASPLC